MIDLIEQKVSHATKDSQTRLVAERGNQEGGVDDSVSGFQNIFAETAASRGTYSSKAVSEGDFSSSRSDLKSFVFCTVFL